jgi:hypothetical protein
LPALPLAVVAKKRPSWRKAIVRDAAAGLRVGKDLCPVARGKNVNFRRAVAAIGADGEELSVGRPPQCRSIFCIAAHGLEDRAVFERHDDDGARLAEAAQVAAQRQALAVGRQREALDQSVVGGADRQVEAAYKLSARRFPNAYRFVLCCRNDETFVRRHRQSVGLACVRTEVERKNRRFRQAAPRLRAHQTANSAEKAQGHSNPCRRISHRSLRHVQLDKPASYDGSVRS